MALLSNQCSSTALVTQEFQPSKFHENQTTGEYIKSEREIALEKKVESSNNLMRKVLHEFTTLKSKVNQLSQDNSEGIALVQRVESLKEKNK